jgi:putative tricarboxylic transport membrane protein
MYRYGYSPAAAALAVILSRGFESSLRRGLALSGDSFAALVTRPVTALLLGIAPLVLVIGSVRQYRRSARRAVAEAEQPS